MRSGLRFRVIFEFMTIGKNPCEIIPSYLLMGSIGIQIYMKSLVSQNYKEAAQALQDAGYATDPTYADKIIHVIEEYNLNKYDR